MQPDSDRKERLLRQAQALCRANGAHLLFLTLFGSTLYGTDLPGASDLDVRGVFLPSRASLALGSAPKSLHLSTGDDRSRNSADDVDMDFWSLQHWLLELMPAGAIGALDLLFSPSNAACTLFRDARLDEIFAQPLRLLDAAHVRSCAEYSMGQAKKYGIRGSRMGAIKTVFQWLRRNCPNPDPSMRLRDILAPLVAECGDGRFCALGLARGGEQVLRLCGREHMASMPAAQFALHVGAEMERCGAAALEADLNLGIDFKALSHALRALDQMEELLVTGKITYPLATRDNLVAVKRGARSWVDLEPKILARIQEVEDLQDASGFLGHFDRRFAEDRILACYGFPRDDDGTAEAAPDAPAAAGDAAQPS